ncbi:MAG: TRAP transporter small permease subunit [Pseudomonadota bacterium]
MASTTAQGNVGFFSNSLLLRTIGWANLWLMFAFLLNNILTFWVGLPGASLSGGALGILQWALYPAAILVAIFWTRKNSDISLREDSNAISDMNTYFIRACFWAVLLVGVVDAVISFMRIEELLPLVFGEELANNLGKSRFRGPFVHFPLIILGFVIAARTRTLGFHWLALLIVIAELLIVLFRFVFSYEQAFMADLVRYWYGALFLFASAYTLLEEGHVRVDILFANMQDRAKGIVNAIGSFFMGLPLCWSILLVGMGQKTSIINSPILNFETTQAGFGLYLKYQMAAFLGIFAISMMIQFTSYFMAAMADIRGEKGKYIPTAPGGH